MPKPVTYIHTNASPSKCGLVTLSVISHGHRVLVTRLLRDLARFQSPRIALIVITLNLSEERPEVPPELKTPIQWCSNADPRGFGSNHNRAFRFCRTEWFAVVNPDIRLLNDPFERLHLASGDQVGLVAPLVVDSLNQFSDSARGLITPFEILRRRLSTPTPVSEPAWVAGMFLIIRSEVYRGVSGFDERFYLYCEDFDLCARIKLLGWDIVLDRTTTVIHDAQRESHKSIRHLLWHLQSLISMWTSRTWWRYREFLNRDRNVPLHSIHQVETTTCESLCSGKKRFVRPSGHRRKLHMSTAPNQKPSREDDQ